MMSSWHRAALAVVLSAGILGCGAGSRTTPGSAATPTPAAALSTAAVKYQVIDVAGEPRLDCGPPLISSAYEAQQLAAAKVAVARAASDPATLSAVQQRLRLGSGPPFPDSEVMQIYRELLKLQKIQLLPAAAGFHFSYTVEVRSTAHEVQGSVTRAGGVTVDRVGPSQFVSCPICLTRGTLIATPAGPVPVELMREGMAVYTAGVDGRRVAVVAVRVGSSPAPPNHRVLTIHLSDGRNVTASPNHPTADGRTLASLRPSDSLDGAVITSITSQTYQGGRTYDLLPGGPTGSYWADGVLLGSTLQTATDDLAKERDSRTIISEGKT